VLLAALVAVDQAGPPDGLVEPGAHRGVEVGQGPLQRFGGHAQGRRPHPVEPLAEREQRLDAAVAHLGHDRPDAVQRGLHVERRPRQDHGRLGVGTAQVQERDHASSVRAARPSQPGSAGGGDGRTG
jgi:hypothetical protein